MAEARASRGLVFSIRLDFSGAEEEFRHAIALDANLFEAHYFFARSCYVQGRMEEAATLYERAAELKPDDFQSVALLTQIYHSLRLPEAEKDAARRCIERAEAALIQNPENARAAYLGANSLAVLGEVGRAREWAERALAINPDDVLTQYNIACLHCYFGDLEEAADLLLGLLPRAHHETKAWILQDLDFERLHDHPRWQDILRLIAG